MGKTRQELKQDYKNAPPAMGVYLIHNTQSHRFALGSSQNVAGSLNRYQFTLSMGRPGDTFIKEPALLEDYKALGAGAFEFKILDLLKPKDAPGWKPEEDLKDLEKLWLEELKGRGWTSY
jgi:hypothetical protein